MTRRRLLVLLCGGLFAAAMAVPSSAQAQKYRFPIELHASGTQPYVTAYRDHDSGGGIKDWNCKSNTYNGHKGSDFGIGSFPVMDAGSRWVVAAASGKVVFKNDGCFDRCTTADCGCGSGFGNYVKVEHADGKFTYYAHLMKGSVTVNNGDSVKCGERLGKVGSSGNSSGPHLHFEVRHANNSSDEPFKGSCGNSTSFWVTQGAYNALPGDQCEKPPAVDDAKLVSVTGSGASVAPGQSFEVRIRFDNTGNTTWTAPDYGLKLTSGESFGFASPTPVPASTAANKGVDFKLSLTAPTAPGAYSAKFRVAKKTTGFGDTADVDVVVEAGGNAGAGGQPWGSGGAIGLAGNAGSTTGGKNSGQQTQTLDAGSESGCGCRTVGSSRSLWEFGLVLLGAWVSFRRRRRCAASAARLQ